MSLNHFTEMLRFVRTVIHICIFPTVLVSKILYDLEMLYPITTYVSNCIDRKLWGVITNSCIIRDKIW